MDKKPILESLLDKWKPVIDNFNQHGVIEPPYTKDELKIVFAEMLENQSKLGPPIEENFDGEAYFKDLIKRALRLTYEKD
jgi:hypothetical protein